MSKSRMAVTATARRKPEVFCAARVAHISMSCAAPRYCERVSMTCGPRQGKRTMAINPTRAVAAVCQRGRWRARAQRSEEHTSELQALRHLVCRLLLENRGGGGRGVVAGSFLGVGIARVGLVFCG